MTLTPAPSPSPRVDEPDPKSEHSGAARLSGKPNTPRTPRRSLAFCPDLEAARRDLLAKAEKLRPLVPDHASAFIDTTTQTLENLNCRIAVIGQVKAGKSSFVNALIGHPSFLPTDINPWTTAVTRLKFLETEPTGEATMSFRFFDPEEWDRLQNGSGYIRELTERLVPGFETALLKRNVEAIRQRATARIGEELESLLGQTHTYDTYSSDILANYICAGPINDKSANDAEHARIYSDIIHSADINFPRAEGQLPTTVIDTPGTNDPFMVRDEITRRALEQADVYVVVIMARQALSIADVALLRILRGLNKERIVVFINRIDELGDVDTMTPRVIDHVRSGLEREFPGAGIPVIAGSAMWANTAARPAGTQGGVAGRAGDGAKGADATLRAVESAQDVEKRHAQQMQRSGLPRLFEVLNDTIIRARPGHLVRQAAQSLNDLAEFGAHEMERERRAQRIALDASREPRPAFDRATYEAVRDEIAEEARRSERLLEALSSLLVDLEERFVEVLDTACEGLDETLRGELLRYRDRECERLIDTLSRGAHVARWRAETSDIRRSFEAGIMQHYAIAARHFEFLTAAVCEQLDKLLAEWSPDTAGQVSDQCPPLRRQPPAVTALGQFFVLDLSEPFWRRWLMARLPKAERVDQLDRLIRDELSVVVDELVQSLEDSLGDLRAQLDLRLSMYHAMIVAAVEKRSQQAMNRLSEMETDREAWANDEEQRATREQSFSQLEAQAEKLSALRRELSNTISVWNERCEPNTLTMPSRGE